jgi:hypothetical protein
MCSCRDPAGCARVLAAVVRSNATVAFAAERQVVSRTRDSVRWIRRIGLSACLFGLAVVAWFVWLDNSYGSKMPRTADPSAGRTVRIVVRHGAHVFVSPEEADRHSRASSRTMVGAALCVLGLAAAVTTRDRSEFPDAG